MPQLEANGSQKANQVLAWSALMASTLVLAALLQAVATSALVGPAHAGPPASPLSVGGPGAFAQSAGPPTMPKQTITLDGANAVTIAALAHAKELRSF